MSDDQRLTPQLSTRSNAIITSVDWLFEPSWRGERVLARLSAGGVELVDRHGEPADDTLAEIAEVLPPAVDAEQAVLDGIWTAQPFIGTGSAAQHLAEALAEEGLADELPDPIETEKRRAFVAIDLLELDGQVLHNVPYGERRRLLESVIDENVRVRVTPAVRVPIGHWISAWHSSGFSHYVAKHVNSHYAPGEQSEDWLEIAVEPEPGPSMIGRLFGQRPKRAPRIEDLQRK
jgi:ATP-dependent DNA ligase